MDLFEAADQAVTMEGATVGEVEDTATLVMRDNNDGRPVYQMDEVNYMVVNEYTLVDPLVAYAENKF